MHNYGSMTPEELRAVIAGGESLSVEFKRAIQGALNDNAITEAVICLANGEGGLLLLGVEDDGTVTGVAPRHGSFTDSNLLQAMILNKTDTPVATHVQIFDLSGLPVVLIEVPKMPMPVGTKTGKYVRRSLKVDGKPECVPYPLHEMLSVGLAAQGRDYAATPARGSSKNDLDSEEFHRFRRLCKIGKGDRLLAELSDDEILRGLRLVLPEFDDTLTLGAILLFGTQDAVARYVPTAEVMFQELRNGTVAANETMTSPLFRAAERLFELIEVRDSEQELIVGLHRIGIPRVPPARSASQSQTHLSIVTTPRLDRQRSNSPMISSESRVLEAFLRGSP